MPSSGLTFIALRPTGPQVDIAGTRPLLEAGAPSSLLYLGVDDVSSTTERPRAEGETIASEPHVIHTDETRQFGPPGEAEEMAFFRDSEGKLVGIAGRRTAEA